MRFGLVVFGTGEQTDTQAGRHTYTLIAILFQPTDGNVNS